MDTDLKAMLKAKGWSYRKAAKLLRCSKDYLMRVANGKYTSQRLSEKVENLPSYDFFMQANPNFFPTNKKQRKIR